MRRFHVLDLALAAMFVALMAIGANIVSWAPFLQVAASHYLCNHFSQF